MKFKMNRISTDLSGLKQQHFDAIVVGSGYGGGVSAARLAEAGRSVCLLERGRELLPGEYPDSAEKAMKEVQITTALNGRIIPDSNGLMDLRVNDDMSVIVGCGLGGTSLLNANVALEPDPRVLSDVRWPLGLRKPDVLKKYFDIAREMLGSTPLPERYHPNKLKALEVSAKGMDLEATRPPINVTFEDGLSKGGVWQPACNMCGDCCSGCNYGSKNTTLMNYLPFAHTHGAKIITEAGVTKVEKVDEGWRVTVDDRRRDHLGETVTMTAETLVLGAGALGSTEILLRSRSETLTFSDRLGQNFSGNGDVLGFGYDAFWNNGENGGKNPQLPVYGIGAGQNRPDVPEYQPGPCITGVIKVDMDDEDYRKGLVIEEGVAPGAVALGMPLGMFMQQALHGDFTRFPDVESRLMDAQAVGNMLTGGGLGNVGELPYMGGASQTQTFLVMSHDDSKGKLSLNDETDCIVVDWPGVGEQENYVKANKKLEVASDMIWANYIPNPLWREPFGRKLVTVHPVGGCPMADSARGGVVNDECQAFTGDGRDVHEGLYVCDGAVIPTSVGLNPLLTITAVCERAMDQLIAQKGWKRTEALSLTELHQPVDTAVEPVTSDGVLEDVDRIIGMLQGWVDEIAAGKYDEVRATIANYIKALIPTDLSEEQKIKYWETIEGRLKGALLKSGLTRGELASDVSPAIQYVLSILEPVRDHIAAGNYPDAAQLLVDTCGDYSPELAFSEKMSGYVSQPEIPPTTALSDPYRISAKYGELAGRRMVAHFNVVAHSLEKLTNSDEHEAQLTGHIECDFISDTPLRVKEHGVFKLLILNEGEVETWNMVYECGLDAGGRDLFFRGVKTLKRRTGSHWWTDLTTLSVDVYEGAKPEGDPIAVGVISLGVQNLIKQLSTVTAKLEPQDENNIFTTLAMDAILWGDLNSDLKKPAVRERLLRKLIGVVAAASHTGFAQKLQAYFLVKFGAFFGMLVFRAYGELLAYLYNFPGRAALEDKKDPLPMPRVAPLPALNGAPLRYRKNVVSESHPIRNSNGDELQLTRYKAGTKGPVILAPGFATRAASFAIETVDKNLVDCLCEQDYDVWLFDYRSSPMLDASMKPFTVDDVVTEDWPAAVDYIKRTAGVKDMQAIVHCMGSMSCLMSLLKGLEGIRSVVSSQLTLHPVTNWLNKFKADTFFARTIREGLPETMLPMVDAVAPNKAVANLFRGVSTINANSVVEVETKPGQEPEPEEQEKFLQDQVINLLTWDVPFPNGVPCYSPTCHRIFGIYGPVFAHAQLNEATHNAVQTVFGEISTKPFQQLAEIIRQGVAVNAEGKKVYLDHPERLQLPITFLAGALNQEFMPDTSLRTFFWLKEQNPRFGNYYDRIVFEDYAHMDFFLGKRADQDIYPKIIDALERHDAILQRSVGV